MSKFNDTIAAIATPTGRGGLGIVRISGRQSLSIYKALTGHAPVPRRADFVSFSSSDKKTIDSGIAIFFEGPASFTGEDIMECQVHGSRIVLDMLLEEIILLGARVALPGEFTERAFLNNKIDLLQAEAVADLIDANSKKAAVGAMRSLEGSFSNNIKQLRDHVFNAKALIEAALDFPEEEGVDINIAPAEKDILKCVAMLKTTLKKAEEGRVLDHSPTIAIVGRPNVGKSSIINYLSGIESAIVSEVPGTTRDIIKEKVLINGYALTLLDTAGIRVTDNVVEKVGVEKAYKALNAADIVLHIKDINVTKKDELIFDDLVKDNIIVVHNKTDLYPEKQFTDLENNVYVSAKTGEGMDRLSKTISRKLDITTSEEDMIFSRQRHLDLLRLASVQLETTVNDIQKGHGLEVQAESLRQCLACFDELTGKTTSDDVLGAVFSRFCIGK